MTRRRNALVGLVGIGVMVAVVVYILGGLSGRAGGPFEVTATFARVGQLLRVSGDVKMRGVLIGRVAKIRHNPDGSARVTIAIDPGIQIPENVEATVSAKTLLGEKYVQLLDPKQPSSRQLRTGDQIPEDRTAPPLELDQVIRTLVPILDAAKPGDLGGALHALAVGLAGQEGNARDAIDRGLTALQVLATHKQDLDRVLAGLDQSSAALAEVSPNLVGSLRSLDTLSRKLNAGSSDVKAFLRDTPTVLQEIADIVNARYNDLVDISVKGADILDVVADHRNSLPATVAALKTFTQDWDTNLSIPCTNAAGETIGQMHPSLAGSTCWQLWVVAAEALKNPGAYATGSPAPAGATATASPAAYRAQVSQLLALPFGTEPSDVALLLDRALADDHGLVPEALL